MATISSKPRDRSSWSRHYTWGINSFQPQTLRCRCMEGPEIHLGSHSRWWTHDGKGADPGGLWIYHQKMVGGDLVLLKIDVKKPEKSVKGHGTGGTETTGNSIFGVWSFFESDGFLKIILCMRAPREPLACSRHLPLVSVTPPKQLKELKGWVCLSSVLGDPESEKLTAPENRPSQKGKACLPTIHF